MVHLINDVREVAFQSIDDARGRLVVAEEQDHVGFPIRRMFSVSGVGPGETRGGHAHHQLSQLLVCMAGRVEVVCDDGSTKRTDVLDDPAKGLLVPPTIWSEQTYATAETILTVLCDAPYDEADYVRDYPAFLELRRNLNESSES